MRPAPAPVSVPWLRADQNVQIVTVASLPCHWVSHWAYELNRAAKCLGSECQWCNRGIEQQLRVVVGVLVKGRERYLFEFRERHRPVFESLYDLGESAPGRRLKIWKKGPASNSPIQVELLEEESGEGIERKRPRGQRPGGEAATGTANLNVWDIEALVDSLGVIAPPSPRQSSVNPAQAGSGSSSVPSDTSHERVRASG